MNLIGETVKHDKFGIGVIESVANNNAMVLFGNDRRKLSLSYSVGTGILCFTDNYIQEYLLETMKQEQTGEDETEDSSRPALNLTEEKPEQESLIKTMLEKRFAELVKEWEESDKDCIAITSVHEAGHCLITSLLVTPDSVTKAEITSEQTGFMRFSKKNVSDIDDTMISLAGHAAERLYNPALKKGLGSDSDFSSVSKMLKSFYQNNAVLFTVYRKMTHPEEHFLKQLEKDKSFFTDLAEDILKENQDALLALAGELELRRKMSGDEIREVLGRFPVKRDAIKRYRQYISWYKRNPLFFEKKRQEYYCVKELPLAA